jgi:biotin carboxyl carrier protein
MLKIKTNNRDYDLVFEGRDFRKGTINEGAFEWDLIRLKEGGFHIIKDNRSFTVDVLKADHAEKSFVIRVNGNKYVLQAKDRFDLLLEKMGMSDFEATKISTVKAPMPGLVLDIIVHEGSEVKKGDPLLVLEAMKMENIIKSPGDGTVKEIKVGKGASVEKNQVLIQF